MLSRMDKPVYVEGRLCPVCHTHDTVSLVLRDTRDTGLAVVWCEEGHITILKGERVLLQEDIINLTDNVAVNGDREKEERNVYAEDSQEDGP